MIFSSIILLKTKFNIVNRTMWNNAMLFRPILFTPWIHVTWCSRLFIVKSKQFRIDVSMKQKNKLKWKLFELK